MTRKLPMIFLYELRRNFLRKGYLFTTFGIPLLLFVVMFGYNALNSQQEPASMEETMSQIFDFQAIRRAGFVDQAQIIPEVPTGMQGRMQQYPDAASALAALLAREIDVYYVIAEDYLETGDIEVHMPVLSLSLVNTAPIEQLIYTTLGGNLDMTLLARLRTPLTFSEYNLTRSVDGSNRDSDFLMVYIFTITFLLGIFLTNGYLMQSVIEEKENRLVEILITSVRPGDLLAGKILAMGILGMLQIAVWIGAIVLALQVALTLPALQALTILANIQMPTDMLPLMFIYFVLGYLFFAAIYGAIGALSNSMREGPQYAVVFTLPAVIPFYMFAIFLEQPNSTLPVILSLIPITAPISMMIRLSVTAVPVLEVVISLGLLALTVAGSFWLAGRLFRVQTLLSGQTPKLRDIPKLLFSS